MAKKIISVVCKKCQCKNAIKQREALDLKNSLLCKECGSDLFPHWREPFSEISESAFIHQLDRQMLEALHKIPGIDSILRSVLKHSLELSMRLHHQGNFVEASKKQAKSLYQKLENAAAILDIKSLPELYIVQDARVNAYTFGVEKCSIAISSGCLELLTDEEVTSVLAHELGHIKANHVLYKTASRIFTSLADSIAQKTLGLSGLVLYPLQLALLRWDRASELSSDRASLLVVKNPLTVLNALMKLAGGTSALKTELNIDAFIEQAEHYEKTQEEGPLGKYIAVMNSMFTTHPFPIWRAREIIDWVNSGEYFSILAGDYRRQKQLEPKYCEHCGTKMEPYASECIICRHENDQSNPYAEKFDKAFGSFKAWYEKNFNPPDQKK